MKGQETQDAYDKFDYELCGTEIPHLITSDGPRLAMVFSAGELQAKGFKVSFRATCKQKCQNEMWLTDNSILLGKVYF